MRAMHSHPHSCCVSSEFLEYQRGLAELCKPGEGLRRCRWVRRRARGGSRLRGLHGPCGSCRPLPAPVLVPAMLVGRPARPADGVRDCVVAGGSGGGRGGSRAARVIADRVAPSYAVCESHIGLRNDRIDCLGRVFQVTVGVVRVGPAACMGRAVLGCADFTVFFSHMSSYPFVGFEVTVCQC
jgi:hypothetical protein